MTDPFIRRSALYLIVFLIFVSQLRVCVTFAKTSEDEAHASIDSANQALLAAYQAIYAAEQAGANVSTLIGQLTNASNLLMKAEASYRLGDFVGTVSLAANCSQTGENVKKEADELRASAYGSRSLVSRLVLVGSLAGVIAIGLLAVWGWRLFKARYYRRVIGMRPEVSV